MTHPEGKYVHVRDVSIPNVLLSGALYGTFISLLWLAFVGSSGWTGWPLAVASGVTTLLLVLIVDKRIEHWMDEVGIYEERGRKSSFIAFVDIRSVTTTRAFRGADWVHVHSMDGRDISIIFQGQTRDLRTELGSKLVALGVAQRLSRDARGALEIGDTR